MENILNFLFFRKFYIINLLFDGMKYLKRSKKLFFQFLILYFHDLFAIQSKIIPKDITIGLYIFILSVFLKFLSIIEVFLVDNYQLF